MAGRDPKRKKMWVCLTDGERALQGQAGSALGKRAGRYKDGRGKLTLILDIFHAMEYLWKTGHALFGEGSEKAEEWVADHLLMLLCGKVSRVVAGMRQSATKRGLRGRKLETVEGAAAYFMRNRERMRYDEYLAAGLPIGSGAAEGACRNLVKDRLERTGMRWSMDGAEAVLKMRAVELTGDTDAYWAYHIQQEHDRLYAPREYCAIFSLTLYRRAA